MQEKKSYFTIDDLTYFISFITDPSNYEKAFKEEETGEMKDGRDKQEQNKKDAL